jgi:hypothetical protein
MDNIPDVTIRLAYRICVHEHEQQLIL